MKKLIISTIRFYQRIPFSSHQKCRFQPTCSEYAIEAILEWGCLKGILLSVKRILRCNPWGSFGFDPVPKKEVKE